MGEGEWQGDRVWVIVEVWEAQVVTERVWVGVKVATLEEVGFAGEAEEEGGGEVEGELHDV